MMQTNFVDFKRKREIGEIISDTFKFLRKNFKIIFRILAKTAGIPFILFLAATAYNASMALDSVFFDVSDPFGAFGSGAVILSTLLLYLMIFAYLSFLYGGMMSIIKSYIANDGIINEAEVIEDVKKNTVRIITAGLIKYPLLVIGTLLCIIPGLYLCVPLLLIFPIMTFENRSAGDSFSICFDLIRNEWWMSFISFVVVILIWYAASFVFALPGAIYAMMKTFTMVQEASLADPSEMFDVVFITLNIIASAAQYLLYVFVPITAALIYFNLVERKHQIGSLEKIDNLGKRTDA